VTGPAVLALLVVAGAAAPSVWLRRRIDERATGLRRELAETLDLLAISVEAGLGLEGAMAVVVEEGSGPLAAELARTIQEMELGVSRRDALTHLRRRCQVSEVSTFVQALVQADLLGMPLSRVLKIQADEMRTKRRQWARERAGKLPVKIMFPLVACIFPAILVVILGRR
jgi:tight adherence protein C